MKSLLRFFLVCTLICIGPPAVDAKMAGTMVLERGIVKLRRNYTDQIIREAGQEVVVNEKDEIQTGGNTRVRLFLRQKKESILLYSNSFFQITKVNEKKSELSFPIGKVRCRVKPTFSKTNRSRRQFRLKTVTALIGVKGTDFVAETTGTETSVLTLEGSVEFSSVTIPDEVVEVAENQASIATKAEAPSPPVEVPEEAREKITTEDTGEKWEGVEAPKAEEPKEKKEEKKPKERDKQEKEEEDSKAQDKQEGEAQEATPPEEKPVEEVSPEPVDEPPVEEPVEEPVVEETPEVDIPIDTLPAIPDDPGDVKEETDNLGQATDSTVIITIQEQ